MATGYCTPDTIRV